MIRLPWKAALLICFRYRERQISAKFQSLKCVPIEDTKGFMLPEKSRDVRETDLWFFNPFGPPSKQIPFASIVPQFKDEKLEFAEFNSMTFQTSHVTHNALLFVIVHENKVAVNRKTFPVVKRKSASLTIMGKAWNANANRDTQVPHAVSFLTVKIEHKKCSNIQCSANNTAAASDTRPVYMCCEIIVSNVILHDLLKKCFSIKNNI